MGVNPIIHDHAVAELTSVALIANGGAILIDPSGDIALASSEVTADAAHTARTNSFRAPSWAQGTASFTCDDGTWVHTIAVCDGWVLAVQTRVGPDLAALLEPLRRARNALALWLGRVRSPGPGTPRPPEGAPAEAFAAPPLKPKN